jgi:glycosyltransferase involved in cell wall biosynthesis
MLAPALEPPARAAGQRATARLLVVARWPVGGIRTHLGYNYPFLAAAGYRCTFVGPADGSLDTLRAGLAGPDADFVAVPVRGRRCRLWSAVRALLRGGAFDLVHSHGLTAAAHVAVANLGHGAPHVVTLHEPLRAGQFPGAAGRLRRWALGRALARADAVVTVSDDARANLLEHLAPLRRRPGRLHTLPNGIDAARYEDVDDRPGGELRRRLGLAGGPALVGFLGRFMPEKGFPLLLDAVGQLAGGGPPFHVAAFGSSDYRREYEKAIQRGGLAGRVTLLDFVPDVLPVLRQLDLVVVPSLWEASSLLSMEAMAAGVPVLGSDCPGLREVLRGTPARTVPAGDADALARGLRAALEAPWAAEARAFAPAARDRFDNARSARRLTALYDDLLGGSTRHPTTQPPNDPVSRS